MDYEISYHPELKKRYPAEKTERKRGKWLLTAAVILLAAVLLKPCVPRVKSLIQEYRQAYDFNVITEHLREGDSLGDSVTAFCLNVLRHAEVSKS